MKSKWIEFNGKQILYQDFSNFFFDENTLPSEEKSKSRILSP